MARGLVLIPQVKPSPEDRPQACPSCRGPALQRWGGACKPLKDPQLPQVEAHSYRCSQCPRTFRHYHQGVTRWDQSQRMVVLAAVLWALGLSLRAVAALFPTWALPSPG
jgi:hypothetical protein